MASKKKIERAAKATSGNHLITIILIMAISFGGYSECLGETKKANPSAKGQDPQKAVAEFESIVEKIKRELHNIPKLAGGGKWQYYVILITAIEVSYDVKVTDSLISPYSGIIKVTSLNSTNSGSSKANYPNEFVRSGGPPFEGFLTAEAAWAAREPQDFDSPGTVTWEARYAYQGNKWVFLEPQKSGLLSRLGELPENRKFQSIILP